MINNHHHKREQKGKQWSQISTESHFWLTAASHKSDGFNKLLLVFTLFIYFPSLFHLDRRGYVFIKNYEARASVSGGLMRIHKLRRNQSGIKHENWY